MATKITLDQLKAQHLKHLVAEIKKSEKRLSKHGLIRIPLLKGASNAMALAVVTEHLDGGSPKISPADVRWNRNQWLKDDSDNAIGHAAADTREKNRTGSMLEPCTETKRVEAETNPPSAAEWAAARARGLASRKAAGKSSKKAPAKKKSTAKQRDVDPADIEF